jgi:hypothetical protein
MRADFFGSSARAFCVCPRFYVTLSLAPPRLASLAQLCSTQESPLVRVDATRHRKRCRGGGAALSRQLRKKPTSRAVHLGLAR